MIRRGCLYAFDQWCLQPRRSNSKFTTSTTTNISIRSTSASASASSPLLDLTAIWLSARFKVVYKLQMARSAESVLWIQYFWLLTIQSLISCSDVTYHDVWKSMIDLNWSSNVHFVDTINYNSNPIAAFKNPIAAPRHSSNRTLPKRCRCICDSDANTVILRCFFKRQTRLIRSIQNTILQTFDMHMLRWEMTHIFCDFLCSFAWLSWSF